MSAENQSHDLDVAPQGIRVHVAMGQFKVIIEISDETLVHIHAIAGRVHATLYVLLLLLPVVISLVQATQKVV